MLFFFNVLGLARLPSPLNKHKRGVGRVEQVGTVDIEEETSRCSGKLGVVPVLLLGRILHLHLSRAGSGYRGIAVWCEKPRIYC